MRTLVTLCVAVLIFTLALGAAASGVSQAPAKAFTVADVTKMLTAGLGEDVIIAKIKKEGKSFDLSADELIDLKKAGASSSILRALMSPASAPATAVAGAAAPSGLPTEIGVYAKKGDLWTEVLPEVVNWKTGGTLKSLASAGVVKKDINGNISGPSSRNSVKTPLEFIIVAAEGISITEYQLIRLRLNKDYREFRTVTGGIMNQQSGAMRDMVPFEGKKLSPRTFSVVLPGNLGTGEYGFLSPGAVGSSGNAAAQIAKMYTFRIIE